MEAAYGQRRQVGDTVIAPSSGTNPPGTGLAERVSPAEDGQDSRPHWGGVRRISTGKFSSFLSPTPSADRKRFYGERIFFDPFTLPSQEGRVLNLAALVLRAACLT